MSKTGAAKKFEVFLEAYLKEYWSVDEKDIRECMDSYSKDLLPLFNHLFNNFHAYIDAYPFDRTLAECTITFEKKNKAEAIN